MRDFVVLAAGSLLSVLAMPNEVFHDGFAFLGPLALLPVFWFTARNGPGMSVLGGVVWITIVTLTSQFWLFSFHPLAFPLVLAFQVIWYALAFGVSSLLWRRFPRSGLWFQALAWTFFEFIRIQGFFSYPYGALATSFWSWPLTFQSADLVGTSGITFLLAWVSAWLAALGARVLPWQRLKVDLTVGLVLWSLDIGYGVWQFSRPETGTLWRPALIQQSQDPWRGGPGAYEAGFDRLVELSRKALVANPDAMIWSETAFVPSVEYHKRYHDNPDSLLLVRRLESFLGSTSVPFLLGNDHREKLTDGTDADYNAVLAWNSGWTGRYEKNRLVPFTESFPFEQQWPWVYQWLKDADTHFWKPGHGYTLLQAGQIWVGTPVCFEDSFPDSARAFSLAGAQALVNLTNDSWASGVASRMQHLSLAVFRSVETRLPLLRAGNDGATAAISRRGEVLAELPVGPPGFLQAEVKLGSGEISFYTRTGDWFAWSAGMLSFAAVALSFRRKSHVDKGG